MGNFYLTQKQHAKALPLLLQAAQISGNDESISRILYAIDLDNVAVAHSGLHNYGIALQYSDNALKQLANLPDSKETRASQGIVLFNRAFAYAEQGLSAQADDSYRRSLELVQTNGESWRRRIVVTNYAKLLRSQQRELDAQELERRYSE
jgi:tetratricopeptide (TPR) repeat protein